MRISEIAIAITEQLTLPASPFKETDHKASCSVNAKSHVFDALDEVISSLCLAVRSFFMRISALTFIARTERTTSYTGSFICLQHTTKSSIFVSSMGNFFWRTHLSYLLIKLILNLGCFLLDSSESSLSFVIIGTEFGIAYTIWNPLRNCDLFVDCEPTSFGGRGRHVGNDKYQRTCGWRRYALT